MRIKNSKALLTELSSNKKNELRLIVAGGSVKKVSLKNLRDRMLSFGRWLQNNLERGDRIHRQIQARKEEIMLQQIRSGLPPKFL